MHTAVAQSLVYLHGCDAVSQPCSEIHLTVPHCTYNINVNSHLSYMGQNIDAIVPCACTQSTALSNMDSVSVLVTQPHPLPTLILRLCMLTEDTRAEGLGVSLLSAAISNHVRGGGLASVVILGILKYGVFYL